MFISFHRGPSCLVAKMSGELDLSSTEDFKKRVDRELRATGILNLVLNLKDLTFIDSTGLGAVLGRLKQITASGGAMVLAEVPPRVLSMLEMAGLRSLIPIARTEEGAYRWIAERYARPGRLEGGGRE